MQLNERQREAVEYLEGPLLVLAGPGTGKTQLLSQKVAYILRETDTNPENILCLTFTETGAANMRERLRSLIGKDGVRVQIGTYHAFGQDILAQY
ncbi:MAG: UvrD-helicase domain-containing protein, partial [Candidatus Saccharibacteria bacterium]|nr:UvrD-helicase domain-containing protein [Candidatus Saccharibacteria bacterium]